jgi:hypothetical protein
MKGRMMDVWNCDRYILHPVIQKLLIDSMDQRLFFQQGKSIRLAHKSHTVLEYGTLRPVMKLL